MNANEKALKALKYIDQLEYSSYDDFVRKATRENKYAEIKQALGEVHLYILVCEKIGESINNQFLETLSN